MGKRQSKGVSESGWPRRLHWRSPWPCLSGSEFAFLLFNDVAKVPLKDVVQDRPIQASSLKINVT